MEMPIQSGLQVGASPSKVQDLTIAKLAAIIIKEEASVSVVAIECREEAVASTAK